jgi:iron complex outermembrane receptor protein
MNVFAPPKVPGVIASIVVAAILLGASPHSAQADPATQRTSALKKMSLDELFDLEVTSVSQKPESLSKTAAAIHVVTSEDLRRMGALSIVEGLRDIPGIEVARVDSRQYAVTARGFNGTVANKLLVLQDGRSLYTPLFSGVFWDAQDAFLDDVAQIEVIRGPGATVWGANAVNGVINVISKDAAQTQGLLLSGGPGNVERGFGGVRYGGTLGSRGFYRVYGKSFDRGPSVRPNGDDAGDDWRMSQGGLRMDWTPTGPDAISLQGDAYGGSEDQKNAPASKLSGGNVVAMWTRRFSPGSNLEVNGYYDRARRDIPSTFGEALNTYDLQLRHHFELARRHGIIWGLGYRLVRDRVHNSPGLAFLPGRVTRQLFTWFAQEELAFADDRARLTFGSKVEHNDYTGFEYQPSARLAWSPAPSHTLWAAVSRAVRTPSRIDRELYSPATPPFFLAGGPGFGSEALRALEVGYKAQPARALTTSIATFYDDYDHLRTIELGSPAVLANNLQGHTYGAETELSYQAQPWWRLAGGYTFLRLDLRLKPGSTDVSTLAQAGDSPESQSFVRSSLTLPRELEVDLAVRQVGNLPNQRVPGYVTGDAHLGWEPTHRVEIGLYGRDLFTPQHPEFGTPASRREVPRSFYGMFTCRFQ